MNSERTPPHTAPPSVYHTHTTCWPPVTHLHTNHQTTFTPHFTPQFTPPFTPPFTPSHLNPHFTPWWWSAAVWVGWWVGGWVLGRCRVLLRLAGCGVGVGVGGWPVVGYEARIRASYSSTRSPLPYEARMELHTSLVQADLAIRASYGHTSLVYEVVLVYEPYTRLAAPLCTPPAAGGAPGPADPLEGLD